MITVTLAHPVSAEQAAQLGAAEAREYRAGESIELPQNRVAAVINAGYVSGVDPNDPTQVAAVVGGTGDPGTIATTSTSSASGTGTDSAAAGNTGGTATEGIQADSASKKK